MQCNIMTEKKMPDKYCRYVYLYYGKWEMTTIIIIMSSGNVYIMKNFQVIKGAQNMNRKGSPCSHPGTSTLSMHPV